MTKLSLEDLGRLTEALRAGHELEKVMSSYPDDAPASQQRIFDQKNFKLALESCADADSPLVKKLSELASKLDLESNFSRDKGLRHLMALLVPLERLAGRSRRDEEFLYLSRDQTPGNATTPKTKPSDVIAVLENIRSSFNVGAIYRTLETFGGTQAWLCGYTPEPLKTAMGTDELIETSRFDRSRDAIKKAKELGYTTVVLEVSDRATPLADFRWPDKVALIVGNERFGVDSETLANCDHIVKIETLGLKNSLNVGVAFGIAMAAASGRESDRRSFRPLGYLRGGFLNPQIAPRQGAYSKATAEIRLEKNFGGAPSNFEQALKDLDGFERAWILFDFHENKSWKPQVRPPRGDGTKRGVFSTRSPHRPNGLGLTCVKILSVDEAQCRIEIAEHDLLDGTPIYDIKPYIPQADAFPEAKAGWFDTIEAMRFEITETLKATQKLDWLEKSGEHRVRLFIQEQLAFQPLDSDRKRVTDHGEHHTIAFRTWRIDFISENNQITVIDIRSGYGDVELQIATATDDTADDPYADKELHRKFKTDFSSTS